MARYLRDQHIKNISVDVDAISHISAVFEERYSQLQAELSETSPQGNNAFFTYIIRFDNKGYRVFSLDELKLYFNQARHVERIIFTVESGDAISSNRNTGAYVELCLDTQEPARCVLASSSDNKDWVEASFAAVHEALAKYKTRNGLARTQWTGLGVQVLGVAIGFIISLWLSFKIAPYLKIDNPFIIAFLFILLLFSNIWGYLNQIILNAIARLFPNIEFIRPTKSRLNWMLQTIVGSAAFGLVLYLLNSASSFLLSFLSNLLSS